MSVWYRTCCGVSQHSTEHEMNVPSIPQLPVLTAEGLPTSLTSQGMCCNIYPIEQANSIGVTWLGHYKDMPSTLLVYSAARTSKGIVWIGEMQLGQKRHCRQGDAQTKLRVAPQAFMCGYCDIMRCNAASSARHNSVCNTMQACQQVLIGCMLNSKGLVVPNQTTKACLPCH